MPPSMPRQTLSVAGFVLAVLGVVLMTAKDLDVAEDEAPVASPPALDFGAQRSQQARDDAPQLGASPMAKTLAVSTRPKAAATTDAAANGSGHAATTPSLDAPTVTTTAPAPSQVKLLFGLGPEADRAAVARLVAEAPVGMLTSWYNGPADLGWMTTWRDGLVPSEYAAGRALHLVVFSDDPETTLDTDQGAACGRAYPLSDRFLDDMRQLAATFAGPAEGPPLYVTLFTEFQTYACTDNAWNPDPMTNTYYLALKDRYLAAADVFRSVAPNARVSLGWGGWQTRTDDPTIGGGRSMLAYFADVMAASDFQSFQAMQSDRNVDDIRAMTTALGRFGPVMVAHYKPDNGSQSTFDADVRSIFTDVYLSEMTARGLFAISFMDDVNINSSRESFDTLAAIVRRYGT